MKRLTKRLLSVILSTTLLFSLGGCSDIRVKEKDNPFQGIDSNIITFEAALTPKKTDSVFERVCFGIKPLRFRRAS